MSLLRLALGLLAARLLLADSADGEVPSGTRRTFKVIISSSDSATESHTSINGDEPKTKSNAVHQSTGLQFEAIIDDVQLHRAGARQHNPKERVFHLAVENCRTLTKKGSSHWIVGAPNDEIAASFDSFGFYFAMDSGTVTRIWHTETNQTDHLTM